jgi:hypothetical protein
VPDQIFLSFLFRWLQNNRLGGTIPAEIGQLTKLTEIYCYFNQLSGTVPRFNTVSMNCEVQSADETLERNCLECQANSPDCKSAQRATACRVFTDFTITTVSNSKSTVQSTSTPPSTSAMTSLPASSSSILSSVNTDQITSVTNTKSSLASTSSSTMIDVAPMSSSMLESLLIGGIAGGVAGGLLLLILIAVCIFFTRRRMHRKNHASTEIGSDLPQTPVAAPQSEYGSLKVKPDSNYETGSLEL